MESWNITPQGSRSYLLHNSSNTQVLLSKRAKPSLTKMLSRLEEANVPIAYTRGLKKIYFTIFSGRHVGDYVNGVVRIDARSENDFMLSEVMIHELAHHIDDEELISEIPAVRAEKKKASKYLEDKYAKKSISEYVAVCFEVFYFGSPPEIESLRKRNPAVYSAILRVHKKYSKM